jgi:2-polyprenyl-6-methoxyphenol hydroxylase-like FAD-dependent oxidoreductase
MSAQGVRPGRVLVVGLGISGMATAVRLRGLGWEPMIVERASGRRTGGYFIATMGTGQAAASRLGILDALPDRTPRHGSAMYDIDRSGKSRITLGLFDFPVEPRPMLMLRGDVEQALFNALPGDVEVRYSTVPTAIEQDPDGVDVTLHDMAAESDTTERFDLVVGADGLRSTVRSLVFGPPERLLHRLNYLIAAFELPEPPGALGPSDGAMLYEPGKSLIVYPFADHLPTALFSYHSDDMDAEFAESPAERIRTVYGPPPYGEILGEVIDAFEAADTYLFDSVEQPRVDSWHRGRVVLVGDSAWCPTLYSGMGSSTGLVGGELLGTVFEQQSGGLEAALTEWEQRLRPYTDSYQKIGARAAGLFTPSNRFGIELRRMVIAARQSPLTAPLVNWGMGKAPAITNRNIDIAAATQPVADAA